MISQKAKLNPNNIDPISRIAIMANLIDLGSDPIDYFGMLAYQNGKQIFLTQENLFESIQDSGIVFFVETSRKYLSMYLDYTNYEDYFVCKPVTGGLINVVELDKDSAPIFGNNLLYCIVRLANERNIELEWNLSNQLIRGTLEWFNPLICSIKK